MKHLVIIPLFVQIIRIINVDNGSRNSKKRLSLVSALLILMFSFGNNRMQAQATYRQNANQFAFKLYENISKDNPENIFFSPYSINAAMTLAYAGSKGKTQTAFENVMQLAINQKNNNLKDAKDYLSATQDVNGVKLKVANYVLHEQSSALTDFYTEQLTALSVQSSAWDFINEAESARLHINKAIAKDTDGQIKNLLKEGSMDERTRFALINVIAFNGEWYSKFKEKESKAGDFWTSAKDKVSATFMHQTDIFPYYEDDKVQILELPYQKRGASMLIVLPKQKDSLSAIEKNFSVARYETWLEKLRDKKVEVAFPKFEMSSGGDMSSLFKNLGLGIAFSRGANFSDLMVGDLMLSDIIHKSYIKVNEKGTEASAATVILGMEKGLALPPPVFRADRPFFYMIKDNVTDAILFMGRCSDPNVTSAEFKVPDVVDAPTSLPHLPDVPNMANANEKPSNNFIHVVSKGETLFNIAKQYDVNLQELRKKNGLIGDYIFIGQKLAIEKKAEMFAASSKPIAGPSSYDENSNASNAPNASPKVHKVTTGETLFSISKQYNIGLSELKKMNNLSDNTVKVGEILKLTANLPTGGDVPEMRPMPKVLIYTIQKGDNLSTLARKFKTTVAKIKKRNDLKSDLIFVGQKLEFDLN